jgi:3-oxoacyl-[acyl-carrier protein] reductase
MELGLRGKTALVTGASKGIGKGVAEALAEEGCNLYLVARTSGDLERIASDIRSRHNVAVQFHAADLSKPDSIVTIIEACANADILVNNAGAIPHGTLEQIDDAKLRDVWDLKLFGYINLTRGLYAVMKDRGAGVIVNIIGAAGLFPSHDYYAGAGANAALSSITAALGKGSTEFGVRILGLHPGATRTERLQDIWETQAQIRLGSRERWKEVIPPLPFGRPVEPAEVGAMVAFLVSAKCSYTSGTVYSLSGGR